MCTRRIHSTPMPLTGSDTPRPWPRTGGSPVPRVVPPLCRRGAPFLTGRLAHSLPLTSSAASEIPMLPPVENQAEAVLRPGLCHPLPCWALFVIGRMGTHSCVSGGVAGARVLGRGCSPRLGVQGRMRGDGRLACVLGEHDPLAAGHWTPGAMLEAFLLSIEIYRSFQGPGR